MLRLLVLNVVYQGKVSAQVIRDIQQSKSWASEWLNRLDKEGINGLKTRPKTVNLRNYLKRSDTRLRKN